MLTIYSMITTGKQLRVKVAMIQVSSCLRQEKRAGVPQAEYVHSTLLQNGLTQANAPKNGGHCQPKLFHHPHEPEIGHFELANFKTLQSLIEEKKIDCEFVVQPGVHVMYDSEYMTGIELALLIIQNTAPELAKMMRLVTKNSELEALRIPTAAGAVVTSVAARMWPYKFVSRILEDLLLSHELSGTFNLQTLTPVEGLASDENERWVVKTPRGSIVASKVILATNAYTSHLLPKFADLIVPVRGQMSALVPFPSLAGANRLKTR